MIAKLLSGRLWLTLITGYVFAHCAVTGLLDSQAVAAIVGMVFISYFQRSDRAPKKNQPTNDEKPPLS